MNTIEKELRKENRDKKQTAHSASKRVGRTKKCTLPYETMSKEERKKYMQASEVKTTKLAPMTLSEFDSQTADIRKELLVWYGEKFGWNPAGVAAALGCDYSSAKSRIESFMMLPMFKARQKAQSKADKAAALERRKLLMEASPAKEAVKQDAQQETSAAPSTLPEKKKAVQPPLSAPTGEYEVSLNCEKAGYKLAGCLEGIADSLDAEGVYRISLTISHVGERKLYQEYASCPEG